MICKSGKPIFYSQYHVRKWKWDSLPLHEKYFDRSNTSQKSWEMPDSSLVWAHAPYIDANVLMQLTQFWLSSDPVLGQRSLEPQKNNNNNKKTLIQTLKGKCGAKLKEQLDNDWVYMASALPVCEKQSRKQFQKNVLQCKITKTYKTKQNKTKLHNIIKGFGEYRDVTSMGSQ